MILKPRLIIPESFDACLTYEQQIVYLAKWCGELADEIGGSGSPEIEDLKQRVSALEAEDANISAQIEEISAQLQTLQESLNKKQDELTFDSTPTAGSTNPVTSEGIKAYVDNAVAGGGGTVTIDPTPTENSPNAVQSGGTYDAIQAVRTTAEAAQSAASAASTAAASATEAAESASSAASQAQTAAETAQETANTAQQAATAAQSAAGTAQETAEAANTAAGNAASTAAAAAQTAGAAQTAATQAQQTAAAAGTVASEAQETAEAAQTAATQAQQTADAKQDELTFDSTPTAGSNNPVTSGGIKTYVDNAVSGGGGGGGEPAGPLRGVRAGDLTYFIDSGGWVQQMDYSHDCYLFRPSKSGNATLILDGATWDSGMSISHYASVYMPISVDGNPIIITGGSKNTDGFIGINNGKPTWAAAPMGTSPYLFGSILRLPSPRLVSLGPNQAQYREFYAEVQEDNNFHIGFRDAESVSLPNTYTIFASNGFSVFAYRSGFVDVLDPGTFAVVQSVAIPAGQTPVHLAHIGTHLYLMCEGACYKARSGIAKLDTFEQVFASTYPTSGATSAGTYGAGPDWVSLSENGAYSLITEEAVTYNIMKAMVQGMTAYYNTADEAGHVETPDGVTLPIGNTGYSTSVMFPALRFI